jgi:hypothetical protein
MSGLALFVTSAKDESVESHTTGEEDINTYMKEHEIS